MAVPGDIKAAVDTPALCLAISSLEANLHQVSEIIRTAGKLWRPHTGCHGSPQIALSQLRHGAIGLTCANLTEAEAFAAVGIRDLLITRLPVGSTRLRRFADLCRQADLIVVCDHYVQAQALSAECVRNAVTCRVLVEIKIGLDRTGVRPGRDAIELGRGIENLPNLQLQGIMGYEGHVAETPDPTARKRQSEAAYGILAETRDLYARQGLRCEIISAGSSHSLDDALASQVLTEVQAGQLIFGHIPIRATRSPSGLKRAFTVLTTLVSRPGFERAVLDAGLKSISTRFRLPEIRNGIDAEVLRADWEHLVLELGPASREWRIGDRVELEVDDPHLSTALHDQVFCFTGDKLIAVWPRAQHRKSS